MKKRILSLVLLLIMLAQLLPAPQADAVAAAQSASADLRVMSANVRAEFASWSSDGVAPEATSTRVVKLEKMLNENNPMVVATQEMSPTWYTAFKKLDATKWAWLEESDVAGYSYYNYVPNKGLALNSILYRKDLLTLYTHGVDAYTSRSNGQCIVWGVFTINSTGKQFVVISTHWTPGSDKANERLAQAEQLAKKVNSLRQIYGDTVIVMGDFNCNDETQEFRRFLINSNSVDSRPGADTRGDHLNKIDHITATADASFTYHTICYEANNAYAISDHPFAVADIKLSSALMFDFTDSADARGHYKQGAYRSNAYDYHLAYWRHDTALVSGAAINKSEGTLSFNVSASGNPYVMTSTSDTLDPAKAYGLNFNPSTAEIAKIKFRLTNCELIDSSVSPSVTVSGVKRGSGTWASNKKTYSLDKANSAYQTLTISLTSGGLRSLTQMESLRLSFDNIKNGSVKIDYIYIGKNMTSPVDSGLFFDYSNTATDQSRYTKSAYGGYNYDSTYWTTAGYGETGGFSISNTDGTATVQIKNKNPLGPIFATAPSKGSYQWNANGTCLNYKPSKAEVLQIRFKLSGCSTVSGKTSRLLLVYGGMYDGVYDGDNWENVTDYTYTNDKYLILTLPLSDTFRAAETITQIGIRFQYIESSSGGTATIDYLYIGPEKGLPTQHVYNHKTTKPTCTAQGYTTHTCRTCAYSYTDSYTKATGHSYTSATTTAATCTSDGVKTFTCSKCSHSYTEAITATGHTAVTDEAVAPTCKATGLTEGSHCSVCNAVLQAQTVIPATGHRYIGKVTTEPTCTGTGVQTYTCSNCGDSYTGKIPATGHEAVTDPAVPATCTNSGLTEGSHCSTCGVVLKAQETVARLGHSYNYTDLGNGKHEGVCTRCDKTATATHSYTDGTCLCGAKEIVVDESIRIYHTLDLASDISVSFVVQKSALENYGSYYMEFVLPEYKGNELMGTSTVTVEPVEKGSYYYFTLTGITAVRMGDLVDATLHMTKGTQEYISMTDSYSVATYAYATLEKSTDAKMLTLCADLLRYGAEAQSYKKYRTDALVDAAMTDVHRSYLSSTDALNFTATDSFLGDLASPTITWVGKTLDLGSKVGLKFVFNTKNYSGNVENLSMKVSYAGSNGETKTVTLTGAEAYGSSGSYYSFTFYGLLASELRTIVDVAIYEGETQLSETIRYSAESYASKAATGDLAPLCKALFAYSDSAKAYFAK